MIVWTYVAGLVLIGASFMADIWLTVDYRLVANIALAVLAAVTTVFAAVYGIRSRWQANVVGRIFFVKALILPMVLWQGAASAWIAADYVGREHVRFVIYGCGAVAYTAMMLALLHQQRRDRLKLEAALRELDELGGD